MIPENFSAFTWNIRGINNRVARKNLNVSIQKEKPWVVFIQESKCEDTTEQLLGSIWEDQKEWVAQDAQGQSGGIITIWDNTKLKLVETKATTNWIWTRWKFVEPFTGEGSFINGINMYGPQNSAGKLKLWEDLSQSLGQHKDEPIWIGGDLDCIKNDNEIENCTFRKKDAEQFNNFIQDEGLWDVQIQNHSFTWFSRIGKSSKLDRILLNGKWPNLTEWKVVGLPRKSSDHIPLLLHCKRTDWGPKPTRLFDTWYQNIDCKKLIYETIKGFETSNLTLHQKLFT